MAVEYKPFLRDTLTIPELIALGINKGQWFKLVDVNSLVFVAPQIELAADQYVIALGLNYPNLSLDQAMDRSREEMGIACSALQHFSETASKIGFVANCSAENAVSYSPTSENRQAASRASDELTQDCLNAIAWELAKQAGKKDPTLPNPFQALLDLYGLGVARVWTWEHAREKLVVSLPSKDLKGQCVLLTSIQGSNEYQYQDWPQVFPSEIDQEFNKILRMFAAEANVPWAPQFPNANPR